jgi:hypothetical protein
MSKSAGLDADPFDAATIGSSVIAGVNLMTSAA